MSVFVILRHDYESGSAHAGEFRSPTEIIGVFTTSDKANDYVEKHRSSNHSYGSYGYEVEEYEVDGDYEEGGRLSRKYV